jgi:hypothetical protein
VWCEGSLERIQRGGDVVFAAGGGGGEGTEERQSGSGFGTGFVVRADPVGIYRVRDGEITYEG